MNWGKGITIALALFIGFIVFMVVGFFSHKVDLVSEDYYQREIAYEEEINAMSNANELESRPVLSMSETHFIVQFDSEQNFENAVLILERPNNKKQDQQFVIQDTKTFTILKTDLVPGVYSVKLSYDIEGKNFLQKEEIYI